jgi:hypothetical protein
MRALLCAPADPIVLYFRRTDEEPLVAYLAHSAGNEMPLCTGVRSNQAHADDRPQEIQSAARGGGRRSEWGWRCDIPDP